MGSACSASDAAASNKANIDQTEPSSSGDPLNRTGTLRSAGGNSSSNNNNNNVEDPTHKLPLAGDSIQVDDVIDEDDPLGFTDENSEQAKKEKKKAEEEARRRANAELAGTQDTFDVDDDEDGLFNSVRRGSVRRANSLSNLTVNAAAANSAINGQSGGLHSPTGVKSMKPGRFHGVLVPVKAKSNVGVVGAKAAANIEHMIDLTPTVKK